MVEREEEKKSMWQEPIVVSIPKPMEKDLIFQRYLEYAKEKILSQYRLKPKNKKAQEGEQ